MATGAVQTSGKRAINAIKLDQEDPRNYGGPPYMVVEHAMDEYCLPTCYKRKEERDYNFPDVYDWPDISSVVTSESGSGKCYRPGMEEKMVTEFDATEFRRVDRLGQAIQDGTATESEQDWLVRHVLKESYSGVPLHQKD